MDTVYRIFMYLFPFAVSISLYVWLSLRTKRVPGRIHKIIALVLLSLGFLYTLYRIVATIGTIFSDDSFHFEVMIVAVIVCFFAAIAMAFGEPEK